MRIALDLEEVLADTMSEACASTTKLSPEDFEVWDLDNHVWQVYSGVSDALWRHDPLSIPPMEEMLDAYTRALHRSADTLDIVTARCHVDDSIERWLDHHNVHYDDMVSTSRPKYELSYNVFIDDNPEMVDRCRLLLRDNPHNRHVDATRYKSCDRIHSLQDAIAFV